LASKYCQRYNNNASWEKYELYQHQHKNVVAYFIVHTFLCNIYNTVICHTIADKNATPEKVTQSQLIILIVQKWQVFRSHNVSRTRKA